MEDCPNSEQVSRQDDLDEIWLSQEQFAYISEAGDFLSRRLHRVINPRQIILFGYFYEALKRLPKTAPNFSGTVLLKEVKGQSFKGLEIAINDCSVRFSEVGFVFESEWDTLGDSYRRLSFEAKWHYSSNTYGLYEWLQSLHELGEDVVIEIESESIKLPAWIIEEWRGQSVWLTNMPVE